MSTGDALDRLGPRPDRVRRARRLAQWKRAGHQPLFGGLILRGWVEFFPIHEGHHLPVALVRSR